MNIYKIKKEQVRASAIDWQQDFSQQFNLSYEDIAEVQELYYRLGKRYGLLREFKKNGIC